MDDDSVLKEWLRTFFIVFLVIAFSLIISYDLARADSLKCTHNSSLPISEGVGSDPVKAWKAMIADCVDKQLAESGKTLDNVATDKYEGYIMYCINRKCSKLESIK